MIIETWKAAPTGGESVENLEIHAKHLPPMGDRSLPRMTSEEARRLYAIHANHIVEAMLTHMPQGLTDAIFAEMCRQKASLFVVPQGYNKEG